MCPSTRKTELYTSNANTVAYLMVGLSDHPGKTLKVAQVGEQEVKRQLPPGERILTRVREEKNKLQDSNTQLGE